MEKIIGREKELSKLADYKQSGRSEFLAIYGRRRVGKTFLIRSFFKDKFDFYATGIIDGTFEEEMESFHLALVRYGFKGPKSRTWIQAFENLAQLLERKNRNRQRRLVVFIDELPCLDTKRSGFLHALDLFWNSRASWIDNIYFVVCVALPVNWDMSSWCAAKRDAPADVDVPAAWRLTALPQVSPVQHVNSWLRHSVLHCCVR